MRREEITDFKVRWTFGWLFPLISWHTIVVQNNGFWYTFMLTHHSLTISAHFPHPSFLFFPKLLMPFLPQWSPFCFLVLNCSLYLSKCCSCNVMIHSFSCKPCNLLSHPSCIKGPVHVPSFYLSPCLSVSGHLGRFCNLATVDALTRRTDVLESLWLS